MNKAKKNIVIVGFDEEEMNSIATPSLDEPYYISQEIHYVQLLTDTYKYQGYMLILKNKDNKSIVELDKKYRKLFNKFEIVLVYSKKYDKDSKSEKALKWTNIQKIGRNLFMMDGLSLGEEWNRYKKKKEEEKENIKFNRNKQEKINILYNYIKKYKTRKTREIAKDLKMTERSIQRYMSDLNAMYHNIGYDYSINEWYFFGS